MKMHPADLCDSYPRRIAWVALIWLFGAIFFQFFPQISLENDQTEMGLRLNLFIFAPLAFSFVLGWMISGLNSVDGVSFGVGVALLSLLSLGGIFFRRPRYFFVASGALLTVLVLTSIGSIYFYQWANQGG